MNTSYQTAYTALAAAFLSLAVPATGFASLLIENPVIGRFQDSNSPDGVANSVATVGTTALLAGDGSTSSLFTTGLEFDLQAATDKAAISSASLVDGVTFSITTTNKLGNPNSFDLVGYTASADGSITAVDYDGQPGNVLKSFLAGDVGASTTITADVTAFVQANVAADWIGFRLQPNPLTNSVNSTADYFQFGTVSAHDAKLTVVPEPASLGLLGIGALGLLRRRR